MFKYVVSKGGELVEQYLRIFNITFFCISLKAQR